MSLVKQIHHAGLLTAYGLRQLLQDQESEEEEEEEEEEEWSYITCTPFQNFRISQLQFSFLMQTEVSLEQQEVKDFYVSIQNFIVEATNDSE
jgi:hypothetical protein